MTTTQATLSTQTDAQPHYVAYAMAHGRTPDAQQAHDRAQTRAAALPFILWIDTQRRAFRAAHPEACTAGGSILDHAAWSQFLADVGAAGVA